MPADILEVSNETDYHQIIFDETRLTQIIAPQIRG
jgi:hypothetical protein